MANSWKKYGGIYKSDKYNSIGVGTMVADQVLIRQRVISSSQVEGSLIVGENVSIGLDLSVNQNAFIKKDLYVSRSSYVSDKLYLNKVEDIYNNYTAYIAGNSKSGRLGIGTTEPKSFLDINVSNSATNSGTDGSTIGSTITDVLTIRNSNNKIKNIIAQNMHKSGIVVDTIGNIASMGFYKGNIDISAAIPSVSITADTSNSILTLSSKENNINSSNNTNITSTFNTNIASNIIDLSSANNIVITSNNDLSMNVAANTRLNTNNTLTITTGNVTNINSFVSISKRTANEPLLNGTITIYDNSANIYLVDYYQHNSVKSGNAITVVSSDNSSNSFINIVTPNKKGFSIGGGAYPADISRSMGTIGLTSTDASYQPAQVIVANNTIDKHKITVGINTYSPETSKYVMDINGPTRIGNGEMHIINHNNFQQNAVHFSKQNPSFGVIVGSPYRRDASTNFFVYKCLVTNNGGVTWASSEINSTPFKTTVQYDILDAYSINQNEFISIGTVGSARLGYTLIDTNGTQPTISQNYSVDYNTPPYTFRTVYAFNNINYKILIGGDISNNGSKSVIYYYNVAAINPGTITSTNLVSIDASCSNITHCDGGTNIAYFVGNGIEKVDFSGAVPVSVSILYKNSGKLYTKVYAYDANYVVAIGYIGTPGNTIISYTRNGGGTWTDILNAGSNFNTIYPYPNYNSVQTVQSFTIKNLVLVDNMNGIATGSFIDNSGKKRPLIICTKDGSATWSRIDPKVFYSSGVGNYIENNTLSCIVPSSSNNFVVVNNITDSSSNPIFVSGSSDIIYGYLPNIFNVYSNQVVDVNGGMNVDGKIWQF
jgi:hypothetical protein